MIAIIDYDAGNIYSVKNAFKLLGQEAVATRDEDVILSADHVVLPGVGSFGDAMKKLREYNLEPTIKKVIEKKIPFLAICLGLQVLFEKSEEYPSETGLGIIKGEVKKIPNKEGYKIPHIGWNSLDFENKGRLFEGINDGAYVYFVHSYYACSEEPVVTASTDYVAHMHTSVEKDNVFACQFHPEKSGDVGLKILENFIKITK